MGHFHTLHYIIVQLLIKIQSQQTGNRIYKNTSLYLRAEQVQFIFSPANCQFKPLFLHDIHIEMYYSTRVYTAATDHSQLTLAHCLQRFTTCTSRSTSIRIVLHQSSSFRLQPFCAVPILQSLHCMIETTGWNDFRNTPLEEMHQHFTRFTKHHLLSSLDIICSPETTRS